MLFLELQRTLFCLLGVVDAARDRLLAIVHGAVDGGRIHLDNAQRTTRKITNSTTKVAPGTRKLERSEKHLSIT